MFELIGNVVLIAFFVLAWFAFKDDDHHDDDRHGGTGTSTWGQM